ncbi:head completion/stabilization protein [Spongiibacter sp.]|uniref:head completion/stabilization protein n=1 Tax=Spongiibacter sp. TaxID=2024860 RepID=UPI000C46456A|nr:head completion/stabilization protein [Spongiibacter sp.]MBU70851.1 hypothetical protein [Spongiibacter sp.]
MGSFIPSGQASPGNEPDLPNIPFFPPVSPSIFRDAMDVDTTVSTERINMALQLSLMEVNNSLAVWSAAQIELGNATLAATKDTVYGEDEQAVNHQEKLYQSAVFHLAKARVVEHMRDFDSTAAGHNKADELSQPIDDFKREARRNVRAIMGQPGTVVELI